MLKCRLRRDTFDDLLIEAVGETTERPGSPDGPIGAVEIATQELRTRNVSQDLNFQNAALHALRRLQSGAEAAFRIEIPPHVAERYRSIVLDRNNQRRIAVERSQCLIEVLQRVSMVFGVTIQCGNTNKRNSAVAGVI
ncbi:hypothetical protein [Sphingomonas sp.]|uniref:hypothetical protein n=1 Tax=Sphingomonas sp. TaxID=28214 RepID=UPI0035BC00E1